MRLRGKLGMVTAAASGMARAGAIRFAREGASVAVVDIDADGVGRVVGEITEAGGTAIGIVADLTRDEESRRAVEEAAAKLGGLDFAWNNVGHPGPDTIEGMDMAAYDLAMTLNLRTVVISTEAQLGHMRGRGGGALLYTASTAGLVSSSSPVYCMAKRGLIGFTKAVAKKYGPENIRANAVCPWMTDTPMLRMFVSRSGVADDEDVEERVRARQKANPLQRMATPDEIANAALFLISDEASFVTGVALPVDGGMLAG